MKAWLESLHSSAVMRVETVEWRALSGVESVRCSASEPNDRDTAAMAPYHGQFAPLPRIRPGYERISVHSLGCRPGETGQGMSDGARAGMRRVGVKLRRAAVVIGLVGLSGCVADATPSAREGPLRYVALGDSYTIGTSVSAAESWPSQLVARLPDLELVGNLGVNGYTSTDLVVEELPQLTPLQPEFVTVLIGVNDVVQGVPEADYQANVDCIVDTLVTSLGADRVLCVATPDYTVTPQGAAFGSSGEQRAGIVRFNEILGAACRARGVRFVPDIFEISEAAGTDLSLVARDGLHPSGAQYARWVDAIQPVVEKLLLPSPDR